MVETTRGSAHHIETVEPAAIPSHQQKFLGGFRQMYHGLVAGALLSSITAAYAQEATVPTLSSSPTNTRPLIEKDPLPSPVTKSKGSLVIAGGGKLHPDIYDEFLKRGGGASARIVVIPTASADADLPEQHLGIYWKGQQEGMASVSLLHTRSRDEANNPAFVRPLDEATGVWFSGGKQGRLADAYGGTLVEKRLHDILDRGGVIGGTSAGAAVMSKVMIKGGKETPVFGEGFGLVSEKFIVEQHVTARRDRLTRLLNAMKSYPESVGMGIDESTAVVVENDKVTVMGDAHMRIVTQLGETKVFKAGDTVDLHSFASVSATER